MKTYTTLTAAIFLVLGAATAQAQANAPSDVQTVSNWYSHFLHRQADQGGLNYWVNRLRTGTSPLDGEAALLGGSEYYNIHGNTSGGFVAGLYADVLGRRPSTSETSYWIQQFNQSPSREALARRFLDSAQAELAAHGTGPASQGYAPPQYAVRSECREFDR